MKATVILRLVSRLVAIMALCLFNVAEAGTPLWTFTPLTATTLSVPSDGTAVVQYQVINQSTRTHTLTMQAISSPSITQITTGAGLCDNPFTLTGKASCILSLHVNGAQLTSSINGGPIVCEQGSALQCYQPSVSNRLHITATQAVSTLTAIEPNVGPVAGETGVTLTGTRLTGATGVTFGGVPATSVNVIDATTVTAVTPIHSLGTVDVVVSTPAGGATLSAGYTYVEDEVGQATGGGVIACLNGGLNDLIAATADISTGLRWGNFSNTGAASNIDGAANTAAIVAALGSASSFAAPTCARYQIDSQGNTPCVSGNTCYNDWFLPAGNNLSDTGQLNCLFTNRAAIGGFVGLGYWSSTEDAVSPADAAWNQIFSTGRQTSDDQDTNRPVRCVRAFVPGKLGITPTSGPAAGETGVRLTGPGLTGATAITFGGVPATSVNAVDAGTVTAVTPAHVEGTVDVVISTSAGETTLANGYTYVTNAPGLPSGGGVIACLNGGLNNLIAATADITTTTISWGNDSNTGAVSNTDGATNTATIVAALGAASSYAAPTCARYQIDSQGNTPCVSGNTCYNDWFLPAGNNLSDTGQLNCLFTNRAAIGGFESVADYWSSTEDASSPSNFAWKQNFGSGIQTSTFKSARMSARCVRAFTP